MANVTFPNQFIRMAGNLFTPPDLDNTKKYPALAVAHPFGGVKEQAAGIYARKMAERGYVTLAFDASHQGESGGHPRDTENPAEPMEDLRCAIDYLTALSVVDEDRVGLLGVISPRGRRVDQSVAPCKVYAATPMKAVRCCAAPRRRCQARRSLNRPRNCSKPQNVMGPKVAQRRVIDAQSRK